MTDRVENPRKAIKAARLARLKVINGRQGTIKVYPANETMRAVLRHANGTRFRDKITESVEWPNDSFTTRRLAEGSVLLEPGSDSGEIREPDPTLNPRQQAAVNKPKPKEEPKPKTAEAKKPTTPTPPAAA
jgi:hypothetical protein